MNLAEADHIHPITWLKAGLRSSLYRIFKLSCFSVRVVIELLPNVPQAISLHVY